MLYEKILVKIMDCYIRILRKIKTICYVMPKFGDRKNLGEKI